MSYKKFYNKDKQDTEQENKEISAKEILTKEPVKTIDPKQPIKKQFKVTDIVYGRNGNGLNIVDDNKKSHQINVDKSVNLTTKLVGKYVDIPHKNENGMYIFDVIKKEIKIIEDKG